MAFYILPDSSDEPRLVPLTGTAEQTEAIDAILPLAQRRIRVFDHDLSDTGWNSPEREEVLTAFLLRSRLNRLDLLVRDASWLEGHCPRLRGLQRRFSHLVSVHQCGEPAMHATDPMVIVDERHFVHRFHFEQAGAVAGVFQDGEARALASRFDALWQDSVPTLPPTTLGL